jgi:CubicO group peptidase (beta-lactamase class C family)
MSKLAILIPVVLFLNAGVAEGAGPDAPPEDPAARIDAILAAYAARDEFSGSVLVAEKGKVLLKKGYGLADRERNVPNTPQTQFMLASTAKLITRTAVLLQQDRGRLSIGDRLSEYVPDYPGGDRITISSLINHTSGIPAVLNLDPRLLDPVHAREPIALNELIALFKNWPPVSEPGVQFHYSGAGYVLLAHAVEKTSGLSFGDFVEKNIFAPLGMALSGADWHQALANRAIGYHQEGGSLVGTPSGHMSYCVGASAIYSTVEDLYRFYQGLYHEGFLSEASMRAFTSGRHYGRHAGFRSAFLAMPAEDLVVIMLCNFFDVPVESLGGQIATILLQETVIDIDAAVLDDYVGRYEARVVDQVDSVMTAQRLGDQLLLAVRVPGEEEDHVLDLRPRAPDRFLSWYRGDCDQRLFTFTRDQEGRVDGFMLDDLGWHTRAVKTHPREEPGE